MIEHAPTHHRYLLGGGLSVVVHVALVLGFPTAHASVSAGPGADEGLLWLEFSSGEGGAPAGALALDAPESAAPVAAERVAPRRESRTTAVPEEPSSAVSTEGLAPAAALAMGGSETGSSPASGASSAGAVGGDGVSGPAGEGASASAGSSSGTGISGGEPVHGPRLLAVGNPCAGYFPAGARATHGRVRVEVEVGANGRIESTRVMAEQPSNEGFAGAARACADRLLFTPAHTSSGTPVEGHARLLLSFDRS